MLTYLYKDICKKGLDFMKQLKNLFNNLDKTDLKIMKFGIKICFGILLIAILLLSSYLFYVHNFFLYDLGIAILKLSTYFAVEFIICGIVADMVKRQIN